MLRDAWWRTCQVLTKRSERLLAPDSQIEWPGSVWMGVSVETERYLRRANHLRQTHARVNSSRSSRWPASPGSSFLQAVGRGAQEAGRAQARQPHVGRNARLVRGTGLARSLAPGCRRHLSARWEENAASDGQHRRRVRIIEDSVEWYNHAELN
jgi:hypothetical protein